MNQRYKYLLKNTGIFTLCNFASKILVFLLVPLYTGVLSTEEYGVYDLIVSSISVLYPILSLNIVDAVIRFGMDKKYEISAVALVGLRKIATSIAIVFIGMLVIYNWQLIPTIHGFEFLVVLYYVVYVFNQYLLQVAKGNDKISYMGVAGIISTVVLVASNIYFLLIVKIGLKGFFISSILSCAIPSIFLIIAINYFKIIKKASYSVSLRKEMVKYSLPLVFSTVSWWINSASDRYVVTFFCGVSQDGILSVAYKIPSIINTLFGVFGQAWQISAIKEYDKKDSNDFYENTIRMINTMTILSCSILIALSKPIGRLLYANDFFVAWELAPFLIVSTVFNNASGLLGPILSAIKDTKAMAKSAVYGAVVNVILNIVLVYFIGAQGATIATVISAAVIYLGRKKAVNKIFRLNIDFVLFASAVLLVVEAINVIYLESWFISIFVVLLLLIVNLKEIMYILKKIRSLLAKEKIGEN